MDEILVLGGTPFDRPLADRLGMRPADLRRLLAQGRLRQPVRGVYLDARVPDDLASRAGCLRLRLPPGAVVSRLTAAWLHGVDTRLPEEMLAPVVDCTVPPGTEPVCRPGVRSYTAPLNGDTQCLGGIPCTTATRTAVDALRWLQPHMGLAVADALAAKGLVAPEELRVAVERSAGRKGVVRARRLASLVEPLTESFGESWLRLRLADAGFPRPQAQIEVAPDCCGYRLDLGWPRARIAVEYDGDEFHGSPSRRRRDERRRAHFEQCHGWTVVGVGKGEVLGRSLALERGVGELLGLEPATLRRLR